MEHIRFNVGTASRLSAWSELRRLKPLLAVEIYGGLKARPFKQTRHSESEQGEVPIGATRGSIEATCDVGLSAN
jgi:hypothetical protein